MSRHDELEREQAHIDRAYEALDRLREGAAATAPAPVEDDEGAGGTFQDRFQRERATADARRRLGELRWGDPPLVFGRIDLVEPVDGDDRFHVGRIGVFAEDQTQLVVDWRAPIAEGFYRATRAEPMGVHRRRSFHCRGRRLLDIDDVVLDPAGGADDDLVGEAALLASLAAPRTGRMSDAVATVQAEQDEVIRAPMAGITIVQGAAGTGKTVVALHRAAYLLYTFRDVLDRQGVLLLGPNARFLDYVRDVLPALGEHDARLATVHDLFPGVRPVPDADLDVAAVKADLRMVQVLRRAVRMRQRRVRETVVVPVGRFLLKLDPTVVNHVVEHARRLDGTHNERRRFVEADLVDALYAELRRRNTATVDRMRDPGREGMRHLLRTTPAFVELLERVWPLLRPQDLLHDLFGSRAMLRHAGRDGLLGEDEQELLHRTRADGADDVEWTHADVPLLHEAHALLGPLPAGRGASTEPTEDEQFLVDRVMEHVAASMAAMQQGLDPVMEADLRRSVLDEIRTDTGVGDDPDDRRPDVPTVWGTVLVDEAQDLSPMAWRMVARSCPNQAMTIVGDLAQGTAPWSPRSWDEVVGWIAPRHPARRHELHVNYRTPTELMALAAPFSTAPGRARAVRSSGHPPRAVAVAVDDLTRVAAQRAGAMGAEVPEGRVAVIAGPALVDAVRSHAGDRVEVHTPETVKGLEFDGVVVVEPAQLVGGVAGTAPLYIALTRSTGLLELVHAAPLPGPLAEHL
ncbi:MAG TPA: AAA family ATPase [Acidimicrobiales bacterium]|nr:AAA family ATPase [Acidimicrobiales bacterium]